MQKLSGCSWKKKAGCMMQNVGAAKAARVSRDTEGDTWSGLKVENPKRNSSEHPTVTIVIYNTVAGGVPSTANVEAAVEDMEQLYAACSSQGRLAGSTFDLMKADLTVAQAGEIATKVATQPYTPPPVVVENASVFPTSAAPA